jgi:hypothetical protein
MVMAIELNGLCVQAGQKGCIQVGESNMIYVNCNGPASIFSTTLRKMFIIRSYRTIVDVFIIST